MTRNPAEKLDQTKQQSLTALAWMFFFLADVQTGTGPFLAAYLAAHRWDERAVGLCLTAGGLAGVAFSPLAGAWVDGSHRKRGLVALGTLAVAAAAVMLTLGTTTPVVFAAQITVGLAGALLLPAAAAMTLGIACRDGFDAQFGKNQGFNSAGNVFAAAVLAGVSWWLGLQWIFLAAAAFAVPVWLCLRGIAPESIDDEEARGADAEPKSGSKDTMQRLRHLCADKTLLAFFACAFLFHLANAAMLPQLGEMLAKGNARTAAPFMSACIVTTQIVVACTAAWVGRTAGRVGRKPLLIAGFGVLPVRALLCTLTHMTGLLIGIQILDGVANTIFGVVSVLLVADRMKGTGHFNFAQGALATCVGLGAALSNTVGGVLIRSAGYNVSFWGLGVIAVVALVLLVLAVPETLAATQAR